MIALNDIKDKEEVIIGDTLEQNSNYKLLMSYGLFKGTKLKIIKNDKWQQMILVEFEGKRIAIRAKDASFIKVERLNGK